MTILAHPLVEPGGLGLPPVVVASLALCVLALAARVGTVASAGPVASAAPPLAHPSLAGVPLAGWPLRLVGAALLILSVAAGRFGSSDELENLAPALVVGFGWPALVLSTVVVPRLWSHLDPWDTLLRVLAARDAAVDVRPDVWPAVISALVWVWFWGVSTATFDPPVVGLMLGAYTLVMLAGGLALGRVAWLSRAELVGVFLGWVGYLRGGRLVVWQPPNGALTVLGVLGGGLLYDGLRRSTLVGEAGTVLFEPAVATVGLCVWCALTVGALTWCERAGARLGAAGCVAAALVPCVAAIVVAVALARGVLLIAAQVVVRQASDPFGTGLDLIGTADLPLQPAPLGEGGTVALQVALLVGGAVLGVLVTRRRTLARKGRGPAVAAVAALLAVGVLAVTAV